MNRRRCSGASVGQLSAFVGFRFPPDVIILEVRWYLRFGLSYRDLEELVAERGIQVDDVTLFRWVQRLAPRLIDAAQRFFAAALAAHGHPDEVVTDRAAAFAHVIADLLLEAVHNTEHHGRLDDTISYASPPRSTNWQRRSDSSARVGVVDAP